MKTKLTKMIMSSLAFACALVCLAATMAPGTSATARAEVDRHCSVGHAKGFISVDLRRVRKLRWEPGTESRYERNPCFTGDGTTFNPFGTVNIGGTAIFDVTGGPGTYTVAAACTVPRHPGPHIPNFQYIRRAGCTAGLDSEISSPNPPAGIGVSVGTAVRVP